MGEETGIAWTDHTANFWIGCTKVSEGCRNCYAETLARSRMGLDVWGPSKERKVTKLVWEDAARWNRKALKEGGRARVFLGSLMDFFEDHRTVNPIRPEVWDVIRKCTALDWQILTKRPENIRRMLPPDWGDKGWPHVWLGTSVEDWKVQQRIKLLTAIPARVHFVSYEPALGDLDNVPLDGVHWMIVGGESGPEARFFDLNWARRLQARCAKAGIAFFFKQGNQGRTPGLDDTLDGVAYREFPKEALPRVEP